MHIYEGVLTATPSGQMVLAAGAIAAAAGTAIGLHRLDYERIPCAAVLTSAFFVVSLIQLPLGPMAVHATLIGLMGLILGWAVFPAVLMALILQVLFLPHLGLTSLGLNTLVMALPGVVCCGLFRRLLGSKSELCVLAAGVLAGSTGIVLAGLIGGGLIAAAGMPEVGIGFFVANLPLVLVEGPLTGSVVVLLRKVRPELLRAPILLPARPEVSHG